MEDQKDNAQFPGAEIFTFLPDLYTTISRLSLLKSQHGNNGNVTQSSNSNLLTNIVSHESRESRGSETITIKPGELLEIKDLAATLYPLKQAMSKAKSVVSQLPDIDRTVEEQQQEIRALEAKAEALRKRQAALAVIAMSNGSRDIDMDTPNVAEG